MNGLGIIRDSLHVRDMRNRNTVVSERGTYTPVKEGTVHVWSTRYSTLDRYYPLLSALVSPEERLKAASFKKNVETRRFILRHGLVRALLEQYTKEDPVKLSFIYGRSGKPDLGPEGKFPDIRFSLSRTDEMVCVGITQESEIGLDIVRIQSHYSFSAIEHFLFRPEERQWIAQAVPDHRALRFFRIWALKEALLKASGSDVRMMKEADVSGIMTDTFLDGIYTVNLRETDQKCFIHESGCGEGHHCALAVIPKIN